MDESRKNARRLASEGGAYATIFDQPALHPGPLEGMSVAVKDIFEMSGYATRLGSASEIEATPSQSDAVAVRSLRQAGAAFVGKTAMHELALGVTGINRFEGTPINPLDPRRAPGGSSSGSAVAVADGTATIALGSDTGGSARIPAAFCGVVGFKPLRSSALMAGLFPLAPTLDHLGILGKDVSTIRRAYSVLAGRLRQARVDPAGLRYVWDAHAMDESDAEISGPIEETSWAIMGGRISRIRFSFSEQVVDVSSTILLYEASRVHEQRLAQRADKLGADVVQRLRAGSRISDVEYRDAQRARDSITAEYMRVMGKDSVLFGPTVGSLPPLVDEEVQPEVVGRLVRWTRLANLTGVPAISIPLRGSGGSHIAIQVHGPTDDATLSVASTVEATLRDFPDRLTRAE